MAKFSKTEEKTRWPTSQSVKPKERIKKRKIVTEHGGRDKPRQRVNFEV